MLTKFIGVLAAAAAVPFMVGGVATADPAGDTVYFGTGSLNCSITGDGTVGCDSSPTFMSIDLGGPSTGSASAVPVPVPFLVHEVVIDSPYLPAHPGFDAGTPHTIPGGNPLITAPINHGGATCSTGFHGSFSCQSKGHSFFYYEQFVGG